jgi:hypothetical protein
VCLPVILRPTAFVEDDSFFYLVVARHVAEGAGSTFNGLVPTNGYQPLWMLLCTPLVAAFGGGALVAGVVASAGLFGLAIAAFGRLLERVGVRESGAAAGLLLLTWCASTGFGSEMALVCAVQVALLGAALRARDEDGWRPAAGFGLCLGLLGLARLDAVFVAGVAWAVVARRRPAAAALAAIVAALVLAPYVAWNVTTFGHVVPISGALKSSFPHPELAGVVAKLGDDGRVAVIGGLAALALATRSGRASAVLGILAGGALLHAGYVGAFTRPGWVTTWPWYYTTGQLAAAAAAAVVFDGVRARLSEPPSPGRIGTAVLVLLAALASSRNVLSAFVAPGVPLRSEPRAEVRMARELEARLPPDAVLAVFDMPGIVAWYTRRPVLALDGLTSDFETADAVVERGFSEVMRRHGVTCFLGPALDLSNGWYDARVRDGRVTLDVRSWGDAGTMVLDLDDAALRGAPLPAWGALWDGPGGTCFAGAGPAGGR